MVTERALGQLAQALGPRARRDEPLARYTAMHVGGPADLLVVCESIAELRETLALAAACGVPWMVLGSGCNVLVSDQGVRGLVIINRAAQVQYPPIAGAQAEDGWQHAPGPHSVRAQAGAPIALLARGTVERGLAGLEWATGLPGTVGGAVVGNAGAFEGDIAAVLYSALVLGHDGQLVERPAAWFEFDYRTSRIKRQEPGRRADVLVAAEFSLQPGERAALEARAAEILEWRQTRHPSGATMGSTFKNPPGSHAGYLIEQAGLRGHRIGGAQISELHGNFFMNVGGASAQDVLALIEYARAEVQRQFGITLELEIELLGWS